MLGASWESPSPQTVEDSRATVKDIHAVNLVLRGILNKHPQHEIEQRLEEFVSSAGTGDAVDEDPQDWWV